MTNQEFKDTLWQVCLRPRDRFWDIPVPKIDSAFDNLFVPRPSCSPSTTQQLRKLVAPPYLPPNDWTPRSEAYFVFPLAQGTPGKQCGLAATGVYQPSLRSPWLAVHDGQSLGAFCAYDTTYVLGQWSIQDFPVKKYQGIQRLILGRGGDIASHCQVCKKFSNLLFSHIHGVLFAVKQYESFHPICVRLLCSKAVMPCPNRVSDLLYKRRTVANLVHNSTLSVRIARNRVFRNMVRKT